MTTTAHVDTFARDNLPPREAWPEFIFEVPALRYGERLNAATAILGGVLGRGWGERLAVRAHGGLRWSYAEFDAQASRIARVLVEDMGLVPGNRVLLRAPNNPLYAASFFGVLKAGGIAVGTMPLLRAKELTDIVTKAKISHALCDSRLADELEATRTRCPTLARVLYFGGDAADRLEGRMAGKPATFPTVDTAAEDTALIAFTSGTTGKPKGTMHFHRDLVAACDCWPPTMLRASPDDVFMGSPPYAFTFGLGAHLLFPLRIGACTVPIERPVPELLLPAIAQHRASVLVTAPTAYRAMAAQAKEHDLSSLRKCVSAGEPLPPGTRKLWKDATGIEIIDGIGSTEMFHIFISSDETHVKPGALGIVVPGYRAAVMDDAGNPVPPGTVGRLAVKGPTGCRYLADDRQSQYVQDGWNYTGDTFSADADGYFSYQARADDMIVTAGYNIGAPEVEGALLLHPAVAECGVIGVPDEERGQIVKAFVVPKSGFETGPALTRELQDFVKQSIAPYKYPRAIEYIESLPRSEVGKLQRARLRQLERERRGAQS
jgi:2-aminobenzoate-CoA ligase